MKMTKLENQTQQLTAEKTFFKNQTMEMTVNMTILQNQNEQQRNNRDKLNKMQAAIISYTNFPADLFCPDGVCQTCPKDWIQFQESCYFFYNLNSPWKTWNESRQFCQSMKSDLVVISSLEEQTFIKNTINYYHDVYHGYWIGLQKVNNWIWVDGSPDTLGYWNKPGSSEDFTLIVQNATLNQSWFKNRNGFLNRFICEIKALIF
ncbi:low affinity immunoglobulin epsilon Fc receptor isoform X5 [Oryzias latipes]|uniref:low affinity immunoglobulin epsilon Fc receptor isoform X5 n=1 Tax=Oryzias latipes TaxID=8090 RepID=UPI000CE1A60C|nr:low affinity immunoglobulin epsilon Fc receptor isoform X5 [Oryzias latipes]